MKAQPCDYLGQLEQLGPTGQWAVERIIALTLENLRLKEQLESARASIQQLNERLEQLQAAAHRQAAPFRRGDNQRDPHPARPGRKAGHLASFRPKPEPLMNRFKCPWRSARTAAGRWTQKVRWSNTSKRSQRCVHA